MERGKREDELTWMDGESERRGEREMARERWTEREIREKQIDSRVSILLCGRLAG